MFRVGETIACFNVMRTPVGGAHRAGSFDSGLDLALLPCDISRRKERGFRQVGKLLPRLILLCLLLVTPAIAEPALIATTTPFIERLVDRVPVSGRTLVGLISVSGTQLPDGTGLLSGSMALPADLTTTGMPVCVRVTTQDGRYSAEDSFSLRRPIKDGGRADLDWPTQYADATRSFPLREVAAVAHSGLCSERSELVPVMLGEGDAIDVLQVLVNTRGGAVTAALRDPDSRRTLRRSTCARVTGSSRVAFDARCILGSVRDLPRRVQLRLEQVSQDGLQIEVLESLVVLLSN